MSEKTIDIQDIVKPARLTDDKTGQVYVLDFLVRVLCLLNVTNSSWKMPLSILLLA